MKKEQECKVVVCSECLMSCCWQGIFMCDNARSADIKEITMSEAIRLGLEHPSYFQRVKK